MNPYASILNREFKVITNNSYFKSPFEVILFEVTSVPFDQICWTSKQMQTWKGWTERIINFNGMSSLLTRLTDLISNEISETVNLPFHLLTAVPFNRCALSFSKYAANFFPLILLLHIGWTKLGNTVKYVSFI